uniref:LON peptidase N-terminal domain and ring finger 2 n=1 Tax=Mastacembelus armatus TaxID=205130 RepID=A0A7N8XU14_9TELE
MEMGMRSHQGELFVHPLSNPAAAGICPEMLEVAEEANLAGDFNLAVEIYSSQLADLQQPDRGLCLRKADSLARAGRISEALDSYCIAASLGKLHPEELPLLVETIARSLREKEAGISWALKGHVVSSSGEDGSESRGECEDDEALDLFSCPLCKCLLHEPTTVECGHTFCKRCLEDDSVKDCTHCRQKLNKKDGLPNGRRLNVVLSGLLDKLFATESKARKFWIEGEVLWKKQNLSDALEKYNAAVALVPSSGRLLCQRAELHMAMRNFSQAVHDGNSLCKIKPLWTKAHYLKATALCKAGRNDEALQEYLMCVALKPNWTKVKLEAQKVQEVNTFKAAAVSGVRVVPAELLDSGDMECSLCMRLFYEPVATPCGHTFCLKCLERCLDHNPNCPLCKENLSEYLATRGYNKTLLMEEVLRRYLGDELAERKKIHEEEMKELSNLNQEVPIFVCTMAFPTIPCPLHVFEPRYRLMIRRSMETGTKQFGMCIADELKGFANYGCMLQVRDVKFFPDGRSVVDTIGVSRFKVISHGQRDGYNTAKIEYLEDKKVEGEELVELLKLHDSVYDQANSWFTSLKDNMKSQILSHFGHLPSKDPDPQASPSGPAWSWWLLAVLPLENRAQLTILAMTSLKDRLIAIRRVLIFVTRKRPR